MSEQLEVEMGRDVAHREKEMMEAVHFTMRYIVKDGSDMSPEMLDIAMGVCSGVAQEASGIPKISAMQMMSIILDHRGEHGFASAYRVMVAEEVSRTEFVEQQGVEFG